MSKGYVYILSNPSMPGLVKIGKTTREPHSRAGQLYQTGVPTPFKVELALYSPDCHELERKAHTMLAGRRPSGGREFFAIEVDAAIAAVTECHDAQVREWLDEFMPGYSVGLDEFMHDEGTIGVIADKLEAHPFQVVAAIALMTADEVAPLMDRYRARIARINEQMAADRAKSGAPLQ